MKRVVILSDSLALPREEPEVTFVEDTYPFLLKADYEVFQFSKGGGLIHELREQAHYYRQYKPDIVLLQCGIVDCGCRAFSRKEELFFQSNIIGRIIRRLIAETLTTKRVRNWRKKSWTTPEEFADNCKRIIEVFDNSTVYALSILPVSDTYEEKVPGIRKKVEKYNAILHDSFGNKYIDLSSIPQSGIMTDGHHLTKEGHQFVYSHIIGCITNDKL